MARIDKLLGTISAKGARALVLEPGEKPALELPNGSRLILLPEPAPAGMLELLINEILPSTSHTAFQTSGETRFTYPAGGAAYLITLTRSAAGLRILAEPSEVQGSLPRIALAPERPRSSTGPMSAPPLGAPSLASLDPPVPPAPPEEQRLPPHRVEAPAGEGATLATQLFQAMLQRKGSDLHCSSFEIPIVRVNGDIEELPEFGILGPSQLLGIMRGMAPDHAWAEFEAHHDTDFAYPFEEGNCRFRANFFRDRVGPGLVCRVIPNEIPDPDRLGLPESIRRLAQLPKGLVLVTGPTGSGKSTTLAAILDIANRTRNDHIITIEDPVEFVHPRKRCLVNQREVHTHTRSFKSGLRAALREDPDIVLVGEMRDLETISIALETALTGHLVFGTLHTSSAIGTIDRVVDQFPADQQQQIRVMLSDCLKAVICQTLLKRISGGRVAAMESLFITPAISNLIREAKTFQVPSAMQTGRAYGQRLMVDALMELILTGIVEPMEAYMKCPDREAFMQAIKKANLEFDPREGKTTI